MDRTHLRRCINVKSTKSILALGGLKSQRMRHPAQHHLPPDQRLPERTSLLQLQGLVEHPPPPSSEIQPEGVSEEPSVPKPKKKKRGWLANLWFNFWFHVRLGWNATMPLQIPSCKLDFSVWQYKHPPKASQQLVKAVNASLKVPEDHMKPDQSHDTEDAVLQELNLSYQDLGDRYQMIYFKKVHSIQSIQNVRSIDLSSNSFTDLSGFTFGSVERLSLADNKLSSFDQLPDAPKLLDLDLRRNNFLSAEGCSAYPKLERLVLLDNPMEYKENYLKRVKVRAPLSLKYLDGKEIKVTPFSLALFIQLAFEQEDGDRF